MLVSAVRWQPRALIAGMIRGAAVWLGALAVAIVWCLFLTPIHVTIRHDAGAVPQLRVDGQERKLSTSPVATRHRVTITNISDDAGTVELALPIPDGSPRLKYGDLADVAGQWSSTVRGERLESTQPGSEITIELDAAAPEIPFRDRPDGGRVRIRYAGNEQEIDLRSTAPRWHPVTLPARQMESVAILRSRPLGASFAIGATGMPDGIATGTIGFGAKAVMRKFELSGNQPWTGFLTPAEIATPVFDGIREFGTSLTLAALLILAFTLAGASLAASDATATATSDRSSWIGGFVVGFALFALLANSFAYFLAAEDSAVILGALLLVAIAMGARRRAKSDISTARPSFTRVPFTVSIATALGLWLSFWPLTFVGAGFVGSLQVDSFFYATAANAIQSKSLLASIAADGIIGYGMRSVDLALVASLSSISGLTTGLIWLSLCMALMIVPPLASYHLVLDWLQNKSAAVLTAISVALSAPIASLFFESYLVQYVTTAVLYLNLYTARPFLQALHQPSPSRRKTLAHALTSAFAVLLYPYFAIVPVVTAGIALWRLRRDRSRLFRHLGLLVAMSLAVGNIGYVFLLNHAATGQFVGDLNTIARYIVFPFHDQPRFPAFVFGLAPFHASGEVLGNLVAATGSNPFIAGLASYLALVEQTEVIVVLALIGFAYGLALVVRRQALLDDFGVVLPASLLGTLLLSVVAWQFNGLYAFCKLTWTLATLIPVIIVPALALCVVGDPHGATIGNHRDALVKTLALAAVVLFLAANLIAKAAGPILWFASPNNSAKANTAVAYDLAMLNRWSSAGVKAGTRFAFAEATRRTMPPAQSLRVLAGHTYSALVGRGLVCANCNLSAKLLEFMWFREVDVRAVGADIVVLIGAHPQADVPGWALALRGEHLSIYVRQEQ